MTKRIPAEKYEMFVKKRTMNDSSLLTNLNLKTVNITKTINVLKSKLNEEHEKVTVNDKKLAKLENERLMQNLKDAHQLTDKMKAHKSECLLDVITLTKK